MTSSSSVDINLRSREMVHLFANVSTVVQMLPTNAGIPAACVADAEALHGKLYRGVWSWAAGELHIGVWSWAAGVLDL